MFLKSFFEVLKVAILAEKYATDYTWYVDVILKLIRIAGDYVSEEVWYRVIQIVVNREDVQGYAAKTVFEALQVTFVYHYALPLLCFHTYDLFLSTFDSQLQQFVGERLVVTIPPKLQTLGRKTFACRPHNVFVKTQSELTWSPSQEATKNQFTWMVQKKWGCNSGLVGTFQYFCIQMVRVFVHSFEGLAEQIWKFIAHICSAG